VYARGSIWALLGAPSTSLLDVDSGYGRLPRCIGSFKTQSAFLVTRNVMGYTALDDPLVPSQGIG
jgi:hypothetical protein